MTKLTLEYDTFRNGVPYLRFGKGARTLLFLLGGPGNTLPTGAATAGFTRGMKGFCDAYTVYLVSRKSRLAAGYTTRDMANDYAELIRAEFGGHVDVIIGFSFGGLILQHFAADHAELAGALVIGGAAHRVSPAALTIDHDYARLVHQGKDRDAMATRAAAVFPPGLRRRLLGGLLWVVGPLLMGPITATFRDDVLIEARAELAHESVDSLKRIQAPVLVVCGKDDFAFAQRDVEEMVSLIANATLKVYDQGPSTVFLDSRFATDVRDFAERETP